MLSKGKITIAWGSFPVSGMFLAMSTCPNHAATSILPGGVAALVCSAQRFCE